MINLGIVVADAISAYIGALPPALQILAITLFATIPQVIYLRLLFGVDE